MEKAAFRPRPLPLAALATSLALCLALLGCGAADAEGARSALESTLSALGGSAENAEALLGDATWELQELGISDEEFLRAFFDGFSYSVGEVDAHGDEASAKVQLTTRTWAQVEAAFGDSYLEAASDTSFYAETDELYSAAGEALLECLRAAAPQQVEVEVALDRADGAWRLSEAGRAALSQALLGK